MATTGALNAQNASEVAGPGISWSNIVNATGAPDGVIATSALFGVSSTNWLRLTLSPGSRVPAEATIVGFRVRILTAYIGALPTMNYRVVSGGSAIGGSTVIGPVPDTVLAWLSAGGDSSFAGGLLSLTPAQVNDAFGADVMVSSTEEVETDARIDAIEFEVWYTLPGSTRVYSTRIGVRIGV